jgi:hypothetical protein
VSAAANRFPIDRAFTPRRRIREVVNRKKANMLRINTIARDFFSFLIP